MLGIRRRMLRVGAVTLVASSLVAAGGTQLDQATSSATAIVNSVPATPSCPSVGKGVGCAYVITVNLNGTVSIAAGANTTPIDGRGGEGDDVMVGVVNDSNGVVSSITLNGPSKDPMFGFDSDELCTYNFTGDGYCATNDNGGPSYSTTKSGTKVVGSGGKNPYDAEGPDNTFSGITNNQDSGTINFTTSLLPQGTTYLCLEEPPASTVTATAAISSGLAVSAPSISGLTEGASWSGQVTTFTDTGSISPASEFDATINWGDGSPNTSCTSTSTTCTIGGSNGSYTVTSSHIYQEFGTYYPTVTVTDTMLAVNTATSGSGSASVADAGPLMATSVMISPQENGVSFMTAVATFTDPDTYSPSSEYAGTTIDWGDGTSNSTVASGDVAFSGSNGSWTVNGTHTYANVGTYTVTVDIVDNGGQSATATDTNVMVANSVTSCNSGATCTGNLVSGSLTENASTTNTTNSGYLLLSGATNNGQINCGDGFDHSPSVISESNTFSSASGAITATESFPAGDGVVLNKGGPGNAAAFWVCFSSPGYPFTDITGKMTTGPSDTGLLPMCDPFDSSDPGPCVNSIATSSGGTVTEQITYPAVDAASSDPQFM